MSPDAMPNAGAKIVSQESTGWLLFDTEQGYTSDGHMQLHAVFEFTDHGQKARMDMTTKAHCTSILN